MGIFNKVSGIFGLDSGSKGYAEGQNVLGEQYGKADKYLQPYRDFGTDYGLNALKGVGKFSAPSMDEVYQSPDYNLGLRTIENSAAARGGLMSGNFLRSAQDYAGSVYDREYGRKMSEWQNELARLMGYTNIGYGAAGGSAGLASNMGNALAGLKVGQGEAKNNEAQYMVDLLSSAVGSYLGGGFG